MQATTPSANTQLNDFTEEDMVKVRESRATSLLNKQYVGSPAFIQLRDYLVAKYTDAARYKASAMIEKEERQGVA